MRASIKGLFVVDLGFFCFLTLGGLPAGRIREAKLLRTLGSRSTKSGSVEEYAAGGEHS